MSMQARCCFRHLIIPFEICIVTNMHGTCMTVNAQMRVRAHTHTHTHTHTESHTDAHTSCHLSLTNSLEVAMATRIKIVILYACYVALINPRSIFIVTRPFSCRHTSGLAILTCMHMINGGVYIHS